MLTRFGSQGQLRFLKFANGRNRPAEFLSISQARQIWLCSHFAVHPHVPRAGEEGTMNIPGMMGRGGMMGGAPQASSGDTPQVDTAENVQISSLALLKMLKHGTWRDGATTPRATPPWIARRRRTPGKTANPSRRYRGECSPRSSAWEAPRSVASLPKGFLNRSVLPVGRPRRVPRHFSASRVFSPPTPAEDLVLTSPLPRATSHDFISRRPTPVLDIPHQAARASRWR